MDARTDRSIVQGGRRMFLKLLTAAGVVGGLGLVPKQAAAQTAPGAAGSPRTSPGFTYRRLRIWQAPVDWDQLAVESVVATRCEVPG